MPVLRVRGQHRQNLPHVHRRRKDKGATTHHLGTDEPPPADCRRAQGHCIASDAWALGSQPSCRSDAPRYEESSRGDNARAEVHVEHLVVLRRHAILEQRAAVGPRSARRRRCAPTSTRSARGRRRRYQRHASAADDCRAEPRCSLRAKAGPSPWRWRCGWPPGRGRQAGLQAARGAAAVPSRRGVRHRRPIPADPTARPLPRHYSISQPASLPHTHAHGPKGCHHQGDGRRDECGQWEGECH